MEYSSIDHIHIFTHNLESAVSFFSGILGNRWIGPLELTHAHIRTAFSDDGMEIIQSTGPDKDGVASFLQSHGPGIASLGFRVPDIEEAISRFESNGVALIGRGSYTYRPEVDVKSAVFTPESAHGVPFEIVEFEGVTPMALAGIDWVQSMPWMEDPGKRSACLGAINHLNLFQNDLEASVAFFSPILNCRWLGPIERPELNLRFAYSDVGINIVQPLGQDRLGVADYMTRFGEGAGSLGIKVPDIEAAISELETKGVRLLGRGLQVDVPTSDLKTATFDPDSSHGVMLELVEYQDVKPVALANLNRVRALPWMGNGPA